MSVAYAGRRTNSSPSLYSGRPRYNCNFQELGQQIACRHNKLNSSQQDHYIDDDDDDNEDEFYVIGDRVYVDHYRPGSVAYFGEVRFANGDWVGVVLDEACGNHDGKIHGYEYFQCAPFHGIFVRPHRVSRMPDSALGSSAATSRANTPLPTVQHLNDHYILSNSSGMRSKSPGSSTIGSYYYDDDYRLTRAPSVASLERKLRTINNKSEKGNSCNSKQPTTSGILKSSTPINNSNNGSRLTSSIGTQAQELGRRVRASSVSPSIKGSVFNFRPRRERLDYLDNEPDIDSKTLLRKQKEMKEATTRTTLSSSSEPELNDRVLVSTGPYKLTGYLRFIGQTSFAIGDWAGIELDEPAGKNDGSVLGHRYFHCPKYYGLFVPCSRVKKLDQFEEAKFAKSRSLRNDFPYLFGTMRSTITSPPPLISNSSGQSRSTTPGSGSTTTTSPNSDGNSSLSLKGKNYLSPSKVGCSSRDKYSSNQYSSSPMSVNTTYSNVENWGHANLDESLRSSQQAFDNHSPRVQPKFDDQDIDIQLRKTLSRSRPSSSSVRISSGNIDAPRPKAVQYTFTSSKYNGNPIARRTLLFE